MRTLYVDYRKLIDDGLKYHIYNVGPDDYPSIRTFIYICNFFYQSFIREYNDGKHGIITAQDEKRFG